MKTLRVVLVVMMALIVLSSLSFARVDKALIINGPHDLRSTGAGGTGTGVNGPSYANWDFSAFKSIPVSESKQIQFRAEFFNVLNHPNFRLPDSDVSSPAYNHILAAQPPRLIQLALKFLF